MELEPLSGGHPERPIAISLGDSLQAQVLIGGDRAGRNGHPDHERIRLFLVGRSALPPLVSGVLLVGPVELEQVNASGREMRRR